MTIIQHRPAQREFVHELIDWKRVKYRCQQYPAIGRTFLMEMFKNHHEKPPYYCHYMSWRLGTWEDESLFQRLEDLLCCAETIPNWGREKRSLVGSTDFAEFWSLVWQLQVAEHLCEIGTDVRWNESGPDLSVKLGDEHWYVECYMPRKSFGLLRFLEELLQQLDSDIRISYDPCLCFELPRDSCRDKFLDERMSRFRDPAYLAEAKEAAKKEYPVLLDKQPESSLYIYVDGDDCDAYMPEIIPNQVGDPKLYVELVLKEAVEAKKCSNDLAEHRPNLLAVSFLLNDWQVARMSPERVKSPTLPQIDPNIDALAVSAVGIDQRLDREKLKVMVRSERGECSSSLNLIALV